MEQDQVDSEIYNSVVNPEWYEEEQKKEISIADVTAKITELREADTKSKASKKQHEADSAVVTDLKNEVIEMLQTSGLKNFKVPGIASVSLVDKLSVKTPKTHEEKEQFFTWLKEQGDDMYLQYATVNANSLNSLFKLKQEEAAENGEVLEIPGLSNPSSYSTLSLKK
jgi:hypothetical protein